MVIQTKKKKLYTEVYNTDIENYFTVSRHNPKCPNFDLILALELFLYIGDIDSLFTNTLGRLNPRGLFAFSIEVNDGPEDYKLQSKTMRYAQSLGYIYKLVEKNNFRIMLDQEVILRNNHEGELAGRLFILQKD
jgi:predicted TPR repeat methyltransferase